MRVSETIEIPRPPAEVFERMLRPVAGPGPGWEGVAKGAEANSYTAIAHVRSGPVRIDLDCAFRVHERVPGSAVSIEGQASSPKLGSTYDITLTVRPEGAGSAVDVDGRVDVSGTLAGLGQRYARHELRRVVAQFLGAT
jgi:carbon monoxide dehydrogenase subunit G